MLDIGWTELLVIAVILIVVVGPKDLPPMLRAFGKMTSNLRKMAGDFRTQFDQALREADMDDVRQTLSDAQKLNPANALREAMNPLREMGNEIRNDLQKATAVPPLSEIGKKPENEAGESLLDDLLPTPEMSLPETPPIGGAAPQSASPASAPASATAAASAGTAGTSGAASSPASSPAAASDKPGASSSLVSPAPVAETQTAAPVKKPRAPRATKASSEDAAVPSGSAKRTRTAKAISAAAEPAGAEQVADAKPVRKRAAKASGTATGTNDTDNPANPARTRKKPVTPKDDA
jgi:sec-independent protein translocase protein TatB